MSKKTARNAILSAQPKEKNFDLVIGDQTLKLKARQLTGTEADSVSEYAIEESGKMNVSSFYNCRIIHSVIDATTGEQLFEESDIDSLNGLPSDILAKLRTNVSLANSDLTEAEVEDKKK